MHAAICSIELFIPAAGSLKEKRHVVKSVIGRIRAKVNASVAETGQQEVWQRAEIGVALISGDKSLLDKEINLIRKIADDCQEAEVAHFSVEYW